MKKLMVAVAALLAGSALAQEAKRTPLEAYQGTAYYTQAMCDIAFRINVIHAESRATGGEVSDPEKGDYRLCIQRGKPQLKGAYESALRTVKKAPARAALKEHYIAAVTVLQEIEPRTDELKLHYQQRQGANKARLSELWTRFEAEN